MPVIAGDTYAERAIAGTLATRYDSTTALNGDKITDTVFASTVTPDGRQGSINIALTGPITMAAPTNAAKGAKLRFVFTQDATGGRVVTWNAIYKVAWTPTTTASKINTIDFSYNGTNWIQVGAVVGI